MNPEPDPRLTASQALNLAGLSLLDAKRLGTSGVKEITYLTVAGASAVVIWEQLSRVFGVTGLWPMVVSGNEVATILLSDDRVLAHSPEKTVREAMEFPVHAWFARRRQLLAADFDPRSGIWPHERPTEPTQPTIPITEDPTAETCIALIPVVEAWQAIAYFPVCTAPNYADQLNPVVHAALWRYWNMQWGVQPIFGAYNVIELVPKTRPVGRDSLLALAWEHYCYCPDVLHEAILSSESRSMWHLEDLAASLAEARAWGFWWD